MGSGFHYLRIVMPQDTILDQFNTLPPTAQRQVLDFIAFLQTRYCSVTDGSVEQKTSLADEDFVGMWRDREDMEDSTDWVRKNRAAG